MRIKSLPALFLFLLIISVFYFAQYKQQNNSLQPKNSITPTTGPDGKQAVLGQQTKTSGCIVNGPLADSACSPGAVNNSLTKDILCSSTFSTKSVRNVSSQEKRQVYAEYGITSHQPGQYEVDHLISLELGGSNDIANLWPEAAEPRPGFHEKDVVENYLHKQVCSGAITLQDAQQKIASNWLQIYQTLPVIQKKNNL